MASETIPSLCFATPSRLSPSASAPLDTTPRHSCPGSHYIGDSSAGRTVVAVTADHGEGLDEHGEPTHGLFIYSSTVRVPLIFAGPGVPSGRVVKPMVRLVDVAPTLLELTHLSPLPNIDGHS